MSNLEDLIVSDNVRLGTIPAAWFDEDDVKRIGNRTLVAFDCGLTGEIPANIGVAAHLRELRLGNGEVGRSASRAFTAYESNAVTGSIPASLASLEFLTIFDATRNTLEGSLPENRASRSATSRTFDWGIIDSTGRYPSYDTTGFSGRSICRRTRSRATSPSWACRSNARAWRGIIWGARSRI